MLAMKAQRDPDVFRYHEAQRAPDKVQFDAAMVKEYQQQLDKKVIHMVRRKDVPSGATILPPVWALNRKRVQSTGAIKKYKARLNIDGSRQRKHIDYDKTYALVAPWHTIRLGLILSMVLQWKTCQLDYVLAFGQAPVGRPSLGPRSRNTQVLLAVKASAVDSDEHTDLAGRPAWYLDVMALLHVGVILRRMRLRLRRLDMVAKVVVLSVVVVV